jgi:hypothetical protein
MKIEYDIDDDYYDDNNNDDDDDEFSDIEEIDDETKELLYNSLEKNNNNDYNEIMVKIENIKNIKNKKKKDTYNLNEFVNKFTINEESKKIKKFISKRVADKKEINNTNTNTIVQRNFSPRLPPYNLIKKEKNTSNINNIDINDTNLFPLL